MQCPPQIATILCEILTVGLLHIRALAWNQNHERCAVEADHLHNLPGLLTNYRSELLEYYWQAERVSFVQASSHTEIAQFEPLWRALAEQIGDGKIGIVGSSWAAPDTTAPVSDRV